MPLRFTTVAVAVLVVFCALAASAQAVPTAFTYQGRLTNTEGVPVPDDKYSALFAMYESREADEPFWRTEAEILTSRGVFTVVLDVQEPGLLANRKEVWLEATVAEGKPLPRIKLTSVPFAMRAAELDLPFAGSVSSTSPALSLTNSSGPALQANGNVGVTGNLGLTGRLGVGVSSPQFPVDVNGVIRSSAGGFQFPDGSTQTKAGVSGFGADGYIARWGTGNAVVQSNLYQDSRGYLGLGTNEPRGHLTINANIAQVWPTLPCIVIGNPAGGANILIGRDASNFLSMGWSQSFPPDCAFIATEKSLGLQANSYSGKLGVGTYTPDEKLTVKGNLKVDYGNENTGDLTKGAIKFGLGNTGEGIASKRSSGENQNGLDFYTSSTPRLSITNNGYVGVGTTGPAYKLHVSGGDAMVSGLTNFSSPGSEARIFLGDSSHYIKAIWAEGIRIGSTWAPEALCVREQGKVGIGTSNPAYALHVNGTVAGSGTYVNTSDGRLKTSVMPLSGALEKIMAMRGVSFEWKWAENPSLNLEQGTQIGFIAQEIENVLPEVVRVDNNGLRSIAYSEVIPVLVEAIKDQQRTIDKLQSEKDAHIADLQQQIDELKKLVIAGQGGQQ